MYFGNIRKRLHCQSCNCAAVDWQADVCGRGSYLRHANANSHADANTDSNSDADPVTYADPDAYSNTDARPGPGSWI
jgi:hypothetical protein